MKIVASFYLISGNILGNYQIKPQKDLKVLSFSLRFN